MFYSNVPSVSCRPSRGNVIAELCFWMFHRLFCEEVSIINNGNKWITMRKFTKHQTTMSLAAETNPTCTNLEKQQKKIWIKEIWIKLPAKTKQTQNKRQQEAEATLLTALTTFSSAQHIDILSHVTFVLEWFQSIMWVREEIQAGTLGFRAVFDPLWSIFMVFAPNEVIL